LGKWGSAPLDSGRRFYDPYAGGSVLHRCTKFEVDSSIRSKVIKGVQKFPNRVT